MKAAVLLRQRVERFAWVEVEVDDSATKRDIERAAKATEDIEWCGALQIGQLQVKRIEGGVK